MAHTKQELVGHIEAPCLIAMNQTHSNEFMLIEKSQGALVAKNSAGTACFSLQNASHMNADVIHFSGSVHVVDADACITNVPGVLLSVKTADCMPILIQADDYVAVIHAGRVGSLHEITKRVAEWLYSKSVKNVNVWFGPASCLFCYQIDRDTNTHFDLLQENVSQIKSIFGAGVSLYYSNACTQCDSELYFSFRSGDESSRNVFYISR